MQRTRAPFRADEVGSLLRPPRIKEARAKLEKGEISADDLRKVEDMEIEKVVHKQASIGLKLATDGEFRRSWWHFDFLAKLTGCELFHPDEGIQFAGVQTRHDAVRVIGKLDFPDDHPMLGAFQISEEAMRDRACHAEDDDPLAGGAAFPRRPQVDLERGLSRSRCVLRGSRKNLPQGGEGVLRRRLPLSAVRRHRMGLSLLAGRTEQIARARRQPRRSAGDLCPRHQLCDRRAACRHDHHHACLPRQFPLHLDFVRRL